MRRFPALAGFAAFGLFWGCWANLLPGLQQAAGIGYGRVGAALAGTALVAVPALLATGRLVDRVPTSRAVPAAVGLFGLAAVVAAAVPRLLLNWGALGLLGVASGVMDVVLNSAVSEWERGSGRRVMPAAHGCYSLGVLAGGAAGGAVLSLGAPPRRVLLGLGVAILLATVAGLPRGERAAPLTRTGATGHRPSRWAERRRLLVLGGLVAVSFLLEDAVQTWSPIRLERGLSAAPWVAGLGTALFAGAMAAGRFGSQLLDRAPGPVVTGGAALTAVGTAGLAVAPGPGLGLGALFLAGAGCGVLAPALLGATGRGAAEGRAGADLAQVNGVGYLAFLAGPPLVGLVSAATGLPAALGLLACLAALLAAAAGPALARTRRPARLGEWAA